MKLILALLFSLFFVGRVLATEIDFSAPLLDLDGKPYRECIKQDMGKCSEWLEHSLGLMSYAALDAQEKNAPPLEPIRRGLLARKVYHAGKVDVSAAEITLIVDQLNKLGLRPAELVAAIEKLDPSRLK